MTFFQWIPDDSNETVSPYLWIYFVVTLGLTFFTVGLWYLFANSKKAAKNRVLDPEKALGPRALAGVVSAFKSIKTKRPSDKLS